MPKKLSSIDRIFKFIRYVYENKTSFPQFSTFLQNLPICNMWCMLNRTTHKLSLWVYYRICIWQILTSYFKFIMPKALQWDISSLSISIFHWDNHKMKIFLHEFTSFDNFVFLEFLHFLHFVSLLLNQLKYEHVKHLKMTIWTSTL